MDLRAINNMSLRDAALTYGKLGWPVLPIRPGNKQPVTEHGLLDASRDLSIIERWWNDNPAYNIGLVTGVVFDVIDLDGEEGIEAFYSWIPDYKHSGPIQSTGRGYHLFFNTSGSKNHARLAGKKVDYRGLRGYIVGAPSLHPKGHKYQWARSGEELPMIPSSLRPLLFPPIKVRKSSESTNAQIREALEKEKNIAEIFEEMGYKITPWGNKAYLTCPFHEGDNQPSLVLYLNTNSFYCYGCDAWGDPLNVRRWQRTGKLRDA